MSEHTTSTVDEYDTDEVAPTMEEIAEQLRHGGAGSRGIVSDADEVIGLTNNCVEVHHHACDGKIIIQLKPHIGWKMGAGDDGWTMSNEELRHYSTYEL